jgi:hypothetical protein
MFHRDHQVDGDRLLYSHHFGGGLVKFLTKTGRQDELWKEAEEIIIEFAKQGIAVDRIYQNDSVRRLQAIAMMIEAVHDALRPIGKELRREFDVGPNEWQTRLVIHIFGYGGTTEDRAWWAKSLTEWWRTWQKEDEREKYGF